MHVQMCMCVSLEVQMVSGAINAPGSGVVPLKVLALAGCSCTQSSRPTLHLRPPPTHDASCLWPGWACPA